MSAVTFSALYLPLLLSALALLVSVVSFFILRSYLKRRTSREWIIQEGAMKEVMDEVNILLKEIDETTDRNITLVTERERSLRALTAEADKRLKVYIREMDKRPAPDNETRAASPAPASTAVPKTSPADTGGLYLDLGKLSYSLRHQKTAAASAPVTEPAPAPEAPKPVSVQAGPLSASDQIASLLKEGIPVQTIASRLGLSIAEVEFKAALLERMEDRN